MRLDASSKLWLVLPAVFGFTLFIIACFALRPEADIVYSARYYKIGEEPSYHHLWRIHSCGSGVSQLTSDGCNDYSPLWTADGKTILFIRETGNIRKICSISEHGGPVTALGVLPDEYVRMESVSPNRRSLVLLLRDSEWKLMLFDTATKKLSDIGAGFTTAWSPDSRRLYVSTDVRSEKSARIIDLATGNQFPLTGDFTAAAWVDDKTLVVQKFVTGRSEKARLVILHADGSVESEVLLPFVWSDTNDGLSPFADNLFTVPRDSDRIVYGRHAGDSTEGDAQVFYLVRLKGGLPIRVAKGRDLAWFSDETFLTGDGRHLELLDQKRKVWVSPLSVVSFPHGKIRTLVQGLVKVEGFDSKRRPMCR